jgi:hypothetical protein
MYRIESFRRPDGRPGVRVELPMLPDPLLDILESVVGAIVRAVDPQAGPISFWETTEKPRGGHPGARETYSPVHRERRKQ